MNEPTSTKIAATIPALVILWIATGSVAAQSQVSRDFPPAGLPAEATLVNELSDDNATIYRHESMMWIVLRPPALAARRVIIPRLFVPLRAMQWKDHSELPLKFSPGPSEWAFAWEEAQPPINIIEVSFDRIPSWPIQAPVVTSAADGSVMLPAYAATTNGQLLRFEPQANKNTIGYWTKSNDYVFWEFRVETPGSYSVAVLQGCGTGQGGSAATFSLHQKDQVIAELPFETAETGHFQNFRWKEAGFLSIREPGEYQLRIRASHIAKAALFDVRAVHLIRQAQPSE